MQDSQSNIKKQFMLASKDQVQQRANLLAINSKFFFVSHQKKLILHDSKSFEKVYTKQVPYDFNIGCLQYGTGIVAVCRESMIHIYDLAFNREITSIDTYQNLVKSNIIKNMLIYMSEQRCIIYDIHQKTNLLYIPIKFGSKSFMNIDYYNIQIFYSINQNVIGIQSLWRNKTQKLNGLLYEKGVFLDQGKLFSLVNNNVVSIYKGQQLHRRFSFQYRIVDIISYEDSIFIRQECTNHIYRIKQLGNRLPIQFNQQYSLKVAQYSYLSAIWVAGSTIYSLHGGILNKIQLKDIKQLQHIIIVSEKQQSKVNLTQQCNSLEKQQNNDSQCQGQKVYDMFENADEVDFKIALSEQNKIAQREEKQ